MTQKDSGRSLLLKNGTCLIHETDEKVEAQKTDILIRENKIVKIAVDISAPEAEIIDCTDKIVSPGFVDTHHHVWHTQLKGRHANHTLVQYLPRGDFLSKLFDADDAFWGQLGGCLEMVDCGTTTVNDYAHISMTREHNFNAISATVASGVRSIFGYCPNPRLKSAVPFEVDMDGLGGHSMPTFDELIKAGPWGDGRVTLGFAYDGFIFEPKQYLEELIAKIDEAGISLIHVHYFGAPGQYRICQAIEDLGILDKRFLFAHANLTKEEADLCRKRGVHYSSTPSTELQMSMGLPLTAFRDDIDVRDRCSFGVDCHSCASSFIPGEARLGLQSARGVRGQKAVDKGKKPREVGYTVEEAFHLATIRGAHAVKMADQIGSIAEGKLADLVVFDSTTPSMVCAAAHDPVAAVILHSNPGDIDTVIINGIVRKRHGKLLDVHLDSIGKKIAGKDALQWVDVARELVKSREGIQREAEKIDMKNAERVTMEAYGLNDADIVDEV